MKSVLEVSFASSGAWWHHFSAVSVMALSPFVFAILLLANPSTYGKLHSKRSNLFGPLVSGQLCWMIFESPNWIWVCYELSHLTTRLPTTNSLLLFWFCTHYIHRSLLYPLSMSPTSKFPIGMMVFTVPYCVVNGYLQAQGLCRYRNPFHTDSDDASDLPSIKSWSFSVGAIMMMIGLSLGFVSDRTLLQLKRTTGSYQIPYGGGFNYVSSPHYLGELVEWWGFCLACGGTLESLSFALWTTSNLVPRALAQHRWYHQKFEDYPQSRMAIVPFIM